MLEQTFADDAQQLVVRLSDETLAYIPSAPGLRGWQCRLEQIGWTSARVSSRGIQEINLHNRQGRVVVTLMPFSGIERFYHSLLQRLVRQTFFNGVRERLPDQIPALERALWLCAQTDEADGAWKEIQIERSGAVVATERSLLLMPHADHELERIPWRRLAAYREIPTGVRFFLAERFIDVPLDPLHPALREYCSRRMTEVVQELGSLPSFVISGVRVRHPELLMDFPLELTALRDAGALSRDEEVLAYASGVDAAGEEQELLLTTQRLVRHPMGEDPGRLRAGGVESTPAASLPRFRAEGPVIRAGSLSLVTDTDLHPRMAARFMEGYRQLLAESLDPFSPDENSAPPRTIPARILPGQDPFNLDAAPAPA